MEDKDQKAIAITKTTEEAPEATADGALPGTITLGGREFNMVLDLNAMVDFEKATNKTIWSIGEGFNATDLRALIWASIRHEDTNLRISEVGGWITMKNMDALTAAMKTMLSGAMPSTADDKKKIKKVG